MRTSCATTRRAHPRSCSELLDAYPDGGGDARRDDGCTRHGHLGRACNGRRRPAAGGAHERRRTTTMQLHRPRVAKQVMPVLLGAHRGERRRARARARAVSAPSLCASRSSRYSALGSDWVTPQTPQLDDWVPSYRSAGPIPPTATLLFVVEQTDQGDDFERVREVAGAALSADRIARRRRYSSTTGASAAGPKRGSRRRPPSNLVRTARLRRLLLYDRYANQLQGLGARRAATDSRRRSPELLAALLNAASGIAPPR